MEIKRILIINEQIIDRLTDLVDGFINEADEYDMEHKDAMAVIDTLVRTNKGSLFGVFNEDRFLGYLAMEICKLGLDRCVSVVHQMYLSQSVRNDATFRELVDAGINWSKDSGAHSIYFSTRRNSEAFKKLLGEGWTIDSTVLRLKLCV